MQAPAKSGEVVGNSQERILFYFKPLLNHDALAAFGKSFQIFFLDIAKFKEYDKTRF